MEIPASISVASDSNELYVTKRNGNKEIMNFDKIKKRIQKISGLDDYENDSDRILNIDNKIFKEPALAVIPTIIASKIINQLFDNITTQQIDIFSAEQSASMATIHPDYNILAGRLIVSNHQKSTVGAFSDAMEALYGYTWEGRSKPRLSDEFIAVVRANAKALDSMCNYERDYLIDYFGFKTLEKSYLMRVNGRIVEQIQHLWMRVAVAIHGADLEKVRETYDLLSLKYLIHATPTLFNAGTPHQQLSSCVLIHMESDSIDGIFNTVKDCAILSKWSAGIGLNIHNIRGKGSPIHGTNGTSNGIVPMLRVFNNTAKYVDQCLAGNTIVYTKDGPVKIRSVVAGMQVFGLSGKLNTVTNVLKTAYDGELLTIALSDGNCVMITAEHPVWGRFADPQKCEERQLFIENDETERWRQFEKGRGGESWINAGEYSVGDYFVQAPNFLDISIVKIERAQYRGTVYDLDVEEEHSYRINGGIVHNGGGKRNGSIAVYLEPWHSDIEDFLEMKKNHGAEDMKARDLFYALWIPDLFMERVRTNGDWTLMCPAKCPRLSDIYGEEFVALYTQYEREGKGTKTVRAQDIWTRILDAQMETGTPYILYKDACNNKSNQKNAGTIKSSNLCTEIMEVSTPDEIAVCNLASIGLPTFIGKDLKFDYKKLHEVVKVATNNLNRVIDINYYPLEKQARSNLKMRPIGLGVQGLADVFMILKVPFYSEEAKVINRRIFETIYHASLEKSMELAQVDGPYQLWEGSPLSQGQFQFDLWRQYGSGEDLPEPELYDWNSLKGKIVAHGVRNSLLVAPMPTASTSQILGFNECFEPITSNIYSRKTIAGNFILTNKYLTKDLVDLKIWNETIKNKIIANDGSVQGIDEIPANIKELYLTVWEIPMKHLINMSAERGQYICQSQSLNLWMKSPTTQKLTAMHFYSWKRGLKTGIYYLRRQAISQAQQFTIEPTQAPVIKNEGEANPVCDTCSA